MNALPTKQDLAQEATEELIGYLDDLDLRVQILKRAASNGGVKYADALEAVQSSVRLAAQVASIDDLSDERLAQ